MKNNYKSVFDIIGPEMIGPSSSHNAGAVKIGRVANKLFGTVPPNVTVHYYGSFARTHRGHGTDYAIAAGLLGFAPDDSRVPSAHCGGIARICARRFTSSIGANDCSPRRNGPSLC